MKLETTLAEHMARLRSLIAARKMWRAMGIEYTAAVCQSNIVRMAATVCALRREIRAQYCSAAKPDIQIHPIAFGGYAFEPLTDAGRQWARNVTSGYPVFRSPDGCMTGFSHDAFGIEPCDYGAFTDDLRDSGLRVSQ